MLVDPNGTRVAIAGYTMSTDMPITQNAYQPVMGGATNVDMFGNILASNGFLAVFDMTKQLPGQGLTYSTYFGGFGGEVIYDMNRDAKGRYYICGYTLSKNLPVTLGNAFNTCLGWRRTGRIRRCVGSQRCQSTGLFELRHGSGLPDRLRPGYRPEGHSVDHWLGHWKHLPKRL